MSAAGGWRGLPPCFDRADLMTMRGVGLCGQFGSREAAKPRRKARRSGGSQASRGCESAGMSAAGGLARAAPLL